MQHAIYFPVLLLALWFIGPSYRHYIRENLKPCVIICLLTFLIDLFFLGTLNFRGFISIATKKGYILSILMIIYTHIWVTLTISGLLMAFRAIPFCGKLLEYFVWCALTIPIRIYYLVMMMLPSTQDIFNIFSVKSEVFIGTITNFLTPEVIIKAILPNVIVLIIVGAWKIFTLKRSQPQQEKTQRFLTIFMGMLIFIGYLVAPKYATSVNGSIGYSINVLKDTVISLKYYNGYIIQREELEFDAKQKPQNNVLFILDESIRGDYLSINTPEANTTPDLERYLSNYPDNIFNYGLAMSSATYTYPSRFALLTMLNQLPDDKLMAFSNPTLFDVAKSRGYKTVMINLQGDFPDLVFRQSDLSRIDEVLQSRKNFALDVVSTDFGAADYVRKRLTEEKGLFIFLNKLGTHIWYQNDYPDEEQYKIFTPCLDLKEKFSKKKRIKIINTHKNALRYNVNGFFRHLFSDDVRELKDCTIIYTSDHADSLYEYGIGSHSTGYLEQTIVPFMIFSTDSWVLENLKRPSEIPFTLHHMNIAPTIKSILCRNLNYVSGEYSSLVSVKEFRRPLLNYISKGDPWNCELSQPLSVDENGKIILPVEKYIY